MNTRAIAAEYRLQQWAGIMQDCKESGLSIKAYCENAGIHQNTYFYWQKKLREAACEELIKIESNNSNLVPQASNDGSPVVWGGIDTSIRESNSLPQEGCIRISREGWTVIVESGTDAEFLTETLKAVSRACC